ncbi:MAG TPA: response regulator transcription factor [Candidatus Polarisedimenticolaceae bacterium]|nr:response regulator transcription factor [Candidatus Polarisedimenticolaceae bacterium]
MTAQGTILVVDDDPQIREVVRFAVGREGFRVSEAGNGRDAIAAFEREPADLIILDILMPEMDGTEVCRTIRRRSNVPIIFLSSKDDEVDRILGLELGGDDYVTKPFSPRELIARVRAVLRRGAPASAAEAGEGGLGRIVHGRLTLDLDRYAASWSGREVVLTATEFGLIRTLASFPGKVYTREELMERAYAYDNVVSGRTIDSHVRRLRQKFAAAGGEPIETVHGLGYKVGPCD